MRAMTVVVYFEEGQEPERLTLGETLMGGKITAMAGYDLMHTMEIAEEAIDESNHEKCIEAREKIDAYICNQ